MDNARWHLLARILAVPYLVGGVVAGSLAVLLVVLDLPPHDPDSLDGLVMVVGLLLLAVAAPATVVSAVAVRAGRPRRTAGCGLLLAVPSLGVGLVNVADHPGESALLLGLGLALAVASTATLRTTGSTDTTDRGRHHRPVGAAG